MGLHQTYRLKNGDLVPGVTAVLGNLGWNKNALIHWATRAVLEGKDPDKVVDREANVGTLAHYLIHCLLTGETPDVRDFPATDIERAETCLEAYRFWTRGHAIELIATEQAVISEVHRFGGTVDKVAVIDGEVSLMDFKSSNGVYPEHKVQVAAYAVAWNETFPDRPIERTHILQLGKDDGSFHHFMMPPHVAAAAWEVFQLMRQVHELRWKL